MSPIHFNIPTGNAFVLRMPVLLDDYQTTIPVSTLSDIVVKIGSSFSLETFQYHADNDYIYVDIPGDLVQGAYDVHVTANIAGREIANHHKDLFCIVPWGMAPKRDFVDAPFALLGRTDEETEVLREQLLAAIADAEAKKNEYEQKIHDWDGLAKQGENESATNTEIDSKLSELSTKVGELQASVAAIKVGMVIVQQTETSGLMLESGTTSVWANPIASLSFGLLAPSNGTEAHYRLRFIAASGFTLDAPTLVGDLPSWAEGKTYEMDIVSDGTTNYALVKEW